MRACPKCKNDQFKVDATEYWQWVVDGEGMHISNVELFEASVSLSTEWECTICGSKYLTYEELEEVSYAD